MSAKFVIMGIGNWLLSDDGVGVHAAQMLAQDPPPGVEVVDAGTDALSALSFMEDAARVLLIDAVEGGHPPGTIQCLTEDDLALRRGANAAHAASVLASRHLLSPGAMWPQFVILGVEPGSMHYGMALSPTVAAALPQVIRLSRDIVNTWTADTFHPQQGMPT